MENNLKSSQRRAKQYWFADGLTELGGGALCLLLTAFFVLQQVLPSSSGLFALTFLAVFLVAYGLRKLLQRMRERSTYLRSGFVELKTGWENRRLLSITIIFTLLLLAVQLYLVISEPRVVEVMTVLGGLIFTFIFAMAGHETKLVRFVYLGIFSLVLGVTLAISGIGDYWGMAVLSLVIGGILLIFGMITRRIYLSQTAGIVEAAGEDK